MRLQWDLSCACGAGGGGRGLGVGFAVGLGGAVGRLRGRYPECTSVAKAQAGGSGWARGSWSPRLGRLVNQWAADHAHGLAGGTPILALDMYEHSYHMDFGAKAGGYVDIFMEAVRWANADKLLAELNPHHGDGPRPA